MFEDISTFDVQTPVVGSLLQKLDTRKKDLASEFIKKAPRPGIDLDLQKKVSDITNDNNKFNNNNRYLYLHRFH